MKNTSLNPTSIILGKIFLKIVCTRIDVFERTLSMGFDGKIITFNIFKAIGYPADIHSLCFINIFPHAAVDVQNLDTIHTFKVN